MKKYILILAVFATADSLMAQKSKVVSAYNYNRAFSRSGKCSELTNGVEAINMAITHDQTKNWAKTWYYRGNIYYNILASKDVACKAIDADALSKCSDSYLKTLVLNFDDPELKKLDLKKQDEGEINKFLGAVKNRSRVDDETYTTDILNRKFPGLAGEFANSAIAAFEKKDFKNAQQHFGTSMLLSKLSGRLDTMILYNTALAAEYAGDLEAAKKHYNKLIDLKYNVDGNGADLYVSMSKIYEREGNSEKAKEYIKMGRTAYPDNNNLIVEELEEYLKSGNHQEALTNLNTAIANDDKNSVLFFARGTVYENLKETDKAVQDYKKALELKPEYYDAAFNLGAFYFNQGADKINESNKLPLNETEKYEALKADAKKDFELAVPFVEKAHQLKPGDSDTGNMLIKLYTRTDQYEKAKEIKAKFQ